MLAHQEPNRARQGNAQNDQVKGPPGKLVVCPCTHAQPEPEDRQADEPGYQCGGCKNTGLPVHDDLEGIEDEEHNPQRGQQNGLVKVSEVKEKSQDHTARIC